MIFTITPLMIEVGKKCDGGCCPGALAVNEKLLPGFFSIIEVTVQIRRDRGYNEHPEPITDLEIPAVLYEFVEKFDSGIHVEPITFELPIDHLCKRQEALDG